MQREREREKAMERERQLEIATFVDNKHKYAKKQANIMINEEEEEDNKAKEKRFEEMDQSRQALWKKLFPKISTIERLIVEYPCSLERKGVERRGLLLVTPRHVCFHSPRLNTRVAIYWRVITSLSRATAVNGTVPAIYVTCLGAYHEEFLFHSLADFEQTMGLLVRIWHMALLEEAADRDGDEEAKARLMGITREQLLCEIEREKHRKTFRMPKEELLIAEFCGSLWMENIIQVYEGTLHISANYVCFHADVEGHNFSVVIPFREVLDIISVDSKLIQVNTHSNKFSFSLLWRRQHCCELMVQLWSRRIRSSERLLEKVPPAEGPWELWLRRPRTHRQGQQALPIRLRHQAEAAAQAMGGVHRQVRLGHPDAQDLRRAPRHRALRHSRRAQGRPLADLSGQRAQLLYQARRVPEPSQTV
jgi:hypothetical protein